MRRLVLSLVIIGLPSISRAMPLDVNNPSGIAAVYVESDNNVSAYTTFVVCVDGTGYWWSAVMPAWAEFAAAPVPIAEVRDWTPWAIETNDGRWYWRSCAHQESACPWVEIGAPASTPHIYPPSVPCLQAVGEPLNRLGDIKSRFR